MKREKTNNYIVTIKKIILTLIATLFSSLVFLLKFEKTNGLYLEIDTEVYRFFKELQYSLKDFDISSILLLIFIFYFYYNSFFKIKINKNKKIFSACFAFWFTIITLIGKSFAIDNTLLSLYSNDVQIIKSILLGIGYFFLYFAVILNFLSIDLKNIKKNSKINNFSTFFNKYHILITIIVIIIAWIPIIVMYYPGTATGDTVDSLAQFFNVKDLCWSAKAIELIDSNVIINKHHSVLFTMVLGEIVKIGKSINSYQFGMFLYTILQVCFLIVCFTFLIHYLKKIKVTNWIIISSILFIGLLPIIYFYAITSIKDTPGAILIMIYNIFLLQIIRNYNSIMKNKLYILIFIVIILLILMIKNNSLYIIITSYLTLILVFIKNKVRIKKLILVLIFPLMIFLSYDKIILPSLGVTGTHKKEAYSVQFMQIARLANRNESAISNKDKKIIDKVLDYDAIVRDYSPNLSDSVKNTYRKNVSDKELKEFWKVYFKYFKKYPKLYIASFINSSYAYFFPEVGETSGIKYIDYRIGNNTQFNLVHLEKFSDARYVYELILEIIIELPFFGIFNRVAFYDWFLIFSAIYIISKKKYEYLVPLISLFAILSSCLISPVNGSFRYILSIVFSTPLILGMDYLVFKDTNKN